jgi:hypothetical protein
MPDCAEKLGRHYAVMRLSSDRMNERIQKFKVCLKCADRDIYDVIRTLAGITFSEEEKPLLTETNVLNEKQILIMDDGKVRRSFSIRVARK